MSHKFSISSDLHQSRSREENRVRVREESIRGEEEEEEQVFIANAKGRNGQESPYTQVFETEILKI